MLSNEKHEQFKQIHIDVVSNATDDFNLFHDSHRWSRIINNPFHGPIALGFQIEALIEHKILLHRQLNNENDYISKNKLNFSNYQFSFANAIKPGQDILVDIKKTQITDGDIPKLSNRVSVKTNGKLALIGFKKETQSPLFLNNIDFSDISNDLRHHSDRYFLKTKQGTFFVKRKFMNASNAKNFLCGSLIDQRLFFDELKNKYNYPEMFPCAFISCTLLENFIQEKLDFERSPMVYGSHKISINRLLVSQLKSNDVLHILIQKQKKTDSHSFLETYECYGLVAENQILFRAIVELIPLEAILKIKK